MRYARRWCRVCPETAEWVCDHSVMRHLPNISLVLIDTHAHDLARLALTDTLAQCSFDDVLVCCDVNLAVPNTRWLPVPKWKDNLAYSAFLWQILPHYLPHASTHMLKIEWDGFVIDAGMWSDEFRDYDYVGAPWGYLDEWNVGNGTGLRSLRLMRFLLENRQEFHPLVPEDAHLCRNYRGPLEAKGFRWAPEQLAARFAFETVRPAENSRHFMFHGSYNFPHVLDAERLNQRIALMEANEHLCRREKVREMRERGPTTINPRLAA